MHHNFSIPQGEEADNSEKSDLFKIEQKMRAFLESNPKDDKTKQELLDELNTLSKKFPTNFSFHVDYMFFLYKLESYSECRKALDPLLKRIESNQKDISIDPRHLTVCYYTSAKLFSANGNFKNAFQDLNKAFESLINCPSELVQKDLLELQSNLFQKAPELKSSTPKVDSSSKLVPETDLENALNEIAALKKALKEAKLRVSPPPKKNKDLRLDFLNNSNPTISDSSFQPKKMELKK